MSKLILPAQEEIPKLILPDEYVQPEQEETFENLDKELVDGNDPILKQEMADFDFVNPPEDPIKIAHILAQSCLKYEGLGLSAPQIGLPYRVAIITGQPMICMFNPTIVGYSDEEITMEEGCLSYPNLFIKIKRPLVCRVRFKMPNGQSETRKFDGLTSRIVQHEIDHLNGITFHKRASPVHLQQAKTRLKQLKRRKK